MKFYILFVTLTLPCSFFSNPFPFPIIEKLDLKTILLTCIFRFKVSGGLPLMHVRISDQKMKNVLCLINSIPLPQKSSEQSPERQVNGYNKMLNLFTFVFMMSSFLVFCEQFYFKIFFRVSFIYLVHFWGLMLLNLYRTAYDIE